MDLQEEHGIGACYGREFLSRKKKLTDELKKLNHTGESIVKFLFNRQMTRQHRDGVLQFQLLRLGCESQPGQTKNSLFQISIYSHTYCMYLVLREYEDVGSITIQFLSIFFFPCFIRVISVVVPCVIATNDPYHHCHHIDIGSSGLSTSTLSMHIHIRY